MVVFLAIIFLVKSSVAIQGSFIVGDLPPQLNASYPNQPWNMNTQQTGPDLDGYFNDPNGDTLNYSASTGDNPNINVTIESDNTVTFAPTYRWNGTEYVTFTASDGTYNVNSNNITLQVNYINTAPTIQTYVPSSSSLTITEEGSQAFTISFADDEQDNVTVTWTLNGTTQLQEIKALDSDNGYTNSSSYTFTGNYSNAGQYIISVSVSDGSLSTSLPIGSWTLTISNVNRPPYFNVTIANMSWGQGSTNTMDSLENYVVDPDLSIDDALSFGYITVEAPSNMRVTIDPITYEVNFNPYATFSGEEIVYFKVTDSEGAINYSNNVTITIAAYSAQDSSSAAQASSKGARSAECESYWYCQSWSRCDPDTSTRTRYCEDLAECRIIYYKPPTEQDCVYVPTCYDKIKNNGEDEVDCGGPCPSCWTCYDGIKNQDEDGIDCGGSCKECATCDDGKRNCHRIDKETLVCEEDVDCGGPCEQCDVLSPSRAGLIASVLISLVSLIVLGVLGSMFMTKFKGKHFKFKSKKEKEKHVEEHHIKIGDMGNIEKELDKVAKLIKVLPGHEIIKVLSNLVNRVINHKYSIATYYTQKELVDKMAKIKGDNVIKEVLLHIHSRLYHYKFSGDKAPAQELLHYIRQVKAINRVERQKLIDKHEGKNDEKVRSLFRMYLKRDYCIDQVDIEQAEELTKKILKKEKELTGEEKRMAKFMLSHDDEEFVEDRMGINHHKKNKVEHKHDLKAVAVILILATAMFFAFSPSSTFEGGLTGFVVLDGNETVNETVEQIILCSNNSDCGSLSETKVCDELVYFINTITPTCNDPGIEESSCENVSATEQVNCGNICDNDLGCDYTQCSDSVDNDEDGSIDLDDAGCDDSLDDDESDEVVEEPDVPEEEPEEDYGIQGGGYGILSDSNLGISGISDGTVLYITEDNVTNIFFRGYDNTVPSRYPLNFSFDNADVNDEIFDVMPKVFSRHNSSSVNITLTATENYVWDLNTDPEQYKATILVKANDSSSNSFYVYFNVTNVNDAPSIAGQSPAGTTASASEVGTASFSFTNASSDPDFVHPGVDTLAIDWIFNGTNNETNQSSYTTKTFGYCEAGTYNVTLNVTDSGGLYHNITWTLTISNTNRVPVNNKTFDGYDYLNWTEGTSGIADNITLNQYFNDTDVAECSGTNQDTVTYGYEVLSTDSVNNSKHVNVSIDQSTWVVSYNSPTDWYGVEIIRFYANDSYDLTYSDKNITLNVTNENDAPVLTAISDQNTTANTLFTYQVLATDPDNDNLTYGDNSTIFNISNTTGLISFTPTTDQVDNYSIKINVTDPDGLSDSVIFNLSISLENRLPNITTIYPYGTPVSATTVFASASTTSFPGDITSINLTEGTTVIFNHTSTDPDGNALRCLWYIDGTLKENNSCSSDIDYNYTINYTQAGLKNITLIVDDQQNTTDTTDRFTWNTTIANTNRIPKFAKTLTSESDFSSGTENQTNITSESGNITLGQSGGNYYYNGSYISPAIEIESNDHDNINITSLSWIENNPANTDVSFKVRIATTSAGLTSASWSGSYSNPSNNSITYVQGGYIQFEANLTTTDNSATPIVEDVTINYTIMDAEITGGYSSWLDVREFFNDQDTDDTLSYSVEYISGSDVLDITIDSGIVALSGVDTDGIVIFRFVANDSYSVAYSNNITLTVDVVEAPIVVTNTVSGGGGGGGGSSSPKVKVITEMQPSYLQIIKVNPLEILPDQTIKVPITLQNEGDSTLSEITLSAQSELADLSFEFLNSYVDILDVGGVFDTELYIKSTGDVANTYSVEIIADIAYPSGKDIATVTINPLSNLTEKVNKVMDMIKLNPICRELEEIVVKAQEAMNNKRYDEVDTLLTEAIDGCKYLIAASQKEDALAPRKDFVLNTKWAYISIGAVVLLLLASYFVPILINKFYSDMSPNKKRHKKK